MKKALAIALATVGSLLALRKLRATKAEQDLWAEATDPVR